MNDTENNAVFIAFLGTGNYEFCQYYDETEPGCPSPLVRYVQNATRLRYCPAAPAYLFCTDDAKKKHLAAFRQPGDEQVRIDEECAQQGLAPYTVVDIPAGRSTEELWTVFDAVCAKIPDRARIVFDPTHSFRSLPIIATVMLNYLAVAKNAVLERCAYGAWEVNRGTAPDPYFDLTEFFDLNEWTLAIHDFTEYSHAERLGNVMEKTRRRDCRKIALSRGKENVKAYNQEITPLQAPVNKIVEFAKALQVCDNTVISRINFQTDIAVKLRGLNYGGAFRPLQTLLEQLADSFGAFTDANSRNGIPAARWCRRTGMYQQAATILEETVITLVGERFAEDLAAVNASGATPEKTAQQTAIARRDAVSSALSMAGKHEKACAAAARNRRAEPELPDVRADNPQTAAAIAKIMGRILRELPGLGLSFWTLGEQRNGLNHAWTSPGREHCPKDLGKILDESLREAEAFFP